MWHSDFRVPRGVDSKGKRGRVPQPPPPPPPGGYRILVLVGIPGSGKSTFTSFLEDLGWTRVSQDVLGSREKCRRRAQQVLERGGRVVIDRCNFDQSQRVTWTDLAVSLFLHKDACIAVWLDVDVGVCQERVRSRVGHPTLGPGPASAAVIKRVARDLRPPHRKEGFHAVLRCRGGDQQSLSDAVAVLSDIRGGDVSARPPEMARTSSAPAAWGGNGGGLGGGGGGGGGGGVDHAGTTAWGQPAGIGGGAVPADHRSWEVFPGGGGGLASGTRAGMSVAAAGSGFPSGVAYSPGAPVGLSKPRRESGNGPALAWGAGHQRVGVEGFGGPTARTRGGAASDVSPAGDAQSAGFYPPLPGGNTAAGGKNARRFNGRIGKESPQPMGCRSSSLSSIARLGQRTQVEAAAAALKQPPSPNTNPKPMPRLLTPAEISANFPDRQAPPRVIDPQDVGAPMRSPGQARHGRRGDRDDPPRADTLPLGPSSLQEWTSRATPAVSAHDGEDSRQSQEQTAPNVAAVVDSAGGSGGGVSLLVAGEENEGLGLSDGETFFVLEDMFGGLLPPESLEKIFRESKHNLERAVQEGFRLLEATEADAFPAPSTSTSSETPSETPDESDGEFADVSEWTHNQVETLTDLCLAFEGTKTREDIIAALTASHHDATSAAQLLLDTAPPDNKHHAGGGGGRKAGRRQHQRFGAAARRERKTRAAAQNSGHPGVTAASLLGATCAAERRRGTGGGGRESTEEGGGGEEEEEGDEGLSSGEYRARANDAAEQMKAWFQKAAEAYTRGGRNGGAAAADPSRVGQRWKKKMEAANLRAAREAFRERNPLVRVGYTNDGVSVLKVLALPRSSQCTTPGQLSIDLHLLRRAEALLVLEAVLRVLARGNALFDRLPHRQDISKHVPGGQRYPPEADQDRVESATAAAIEAGAGHCTRGVESGRNLYAERFTSLEVVVGRGAHSVAGVPRLRPCVAGYLAGKHLRAETVEGDRGKGVVVVRLDSL